MVGVVPMLRPVGAVPPPIGRRLKACALWLPGRQTAKEMIAEKAGQIPFRASLDLLSGAVGDDPLRHAAVLVIVLGLEDQRTVRRAA
jgi:hypothetical protein